MDIDLADDAYRGLVYSFDPVLLLFGDREDRLAEARDAAQRVGCRIAGEGPVDGGVARLDAHLGASAAVLIAAEPSADFDLLLDRIALAARNVRMKGVVVTTHDLIDRVAAADLPDEVYHLVDPDDEELSVAILLASEPTSEAFHDISRRNGVAVLQQLSEEAARIASVLASLSGEEPGGGGETTDDEAADAGFVRSIIRARRLRDQFFRGELFADPAFDMLLDLYAARIEGSRVAVSSLCIAAAVPATTALRWIRALTDKGLFIRTADPQDGRRVYIGLSDDAARAMGRYLTAVQKSGLPAI